jgi:hypothetical protein
MGYLDGHGGKRNASRPDSRRLGAKQMSALNKKIKRNQVVTTNVSCVCPLCGQSIAIGAEALWTWRKDAILCSGEDCAKEEIFDAKMSMDTRSDARASR